MCGREGGPQQRGRSGWLCYFNTLSHVNIKETTPKISYCTPVQREREREREFLIPSLPSYTSSSLLSHHLFRTHFSSLKLRTDSIFIIIPTPLLPSYTRPSWRTTHPSTENSAIPQKKEASHCTETSASLGNQPKEATGRPGGGLPEAAAVQAPGSHPGPVPEDGL